MNTLPASQALLESLERRRDHTGLYQRGRDHTIAELLDRAAEWVAYLRAAGVGPGTVCAATGEFSFNTSAFLLATLRLRCTVVPLEGDSGENAQLLGLAAADVVVDLDRDAPNHQVVTVAKHDSKLLRDFLGTGQPGIITFTSGSAGEPKAVLHDFDRALKNFGRFDRKGYRSLIFLRFNHLGGINTLLSVLASTGGVAVFPEQRTAEEIAALVARARVELLPVTPTFLAMLLASRGYERHDMSSLRLISYGAEPMPQSLLDRMNQLFPQVRFHQTYGTTELCLLRTQSRSSDSLWVKLGGDGFEIRVIDGLLYVRSEFAMLGYLNAPNPLGPDGWLATGDRVEQDGEWIRFLGRDSDLINVGGEKVTPQEVESVLIGAENVRDVRVYGEKDVVFGTRIIADVQLLAEEDPTELRRRLRRICLERLARYKVPVRFNITASPFHSQRFKKLRAPAPCAPGGPEASSDQDTRSFDGPVASRGSRRTSMKTEAWFLHEGPLPGKGERPLPRGSEETLPEDAFRLEPFELGEPTGDQCLIEPLYGCWEGNFSHAIARAPVDICRQRGESKVVLGNSGVARVLRLGPDAKGLREGDVCLLFGNGVADRYGYMQLAHAFDAPNTMGLLAKRANVPDRNLMPIPRDSSFTLPQWAAFSLRYITAWANHRVAHGAWRLQVPEELFPEGFPVWAWGGGVAFAQLTLARIKDAARCVLITSSKARRELAARVGLEALDRSSFPDLSFQATRYGSDPDYAARYRDCENRFLHEVHARTDGEGVAIFVDNIGAPVFRVTLKALAREGVVATCGWKKGMRLEILRAMECIARHTFVHTHYASRREGEDAVRFACEHNWMVPHDALGKIWEWGDVAKLAQDYMTGAIDSYFPIFRINSE